MSFHAIPTKELREQLPRIREGLKRGEKYTVFIVQSQSLY